MEPLETNSAVPRRDQSPFPHERRQSPRHKVHTPAYASFNGVSRGMVLDLSEILDISETGVSIQTSSPLEVNGTFNLCLDLSETKSYIHTTGFVVWSDGAGRAGIRFPEMPDSSLRELQEWLLLNSLIACANHAKTEPVGPELVASQSEESGRSASAAEPVRETAAADYMSIQAALHAVEREIESLGSDLDAGLQSLAERAQAFTRATGAAIALAQKEEQPQEMVCRASTGSDAPGPGARLHVGSGFSGECVRTGKLLRCDDSETDPLVDAEICRLLGIRSMIAVPVRDAEKVIGLLEVFSPAPYAFQETDNTVLQRLAGIILSAVNRARIPQSQSAPDAEGTRLAGPPPSPGSVSESLIASASDVSQFEGLPVPRSHVMLLIAVAAALALALGFLLAPWIESKWNRPSTPQPQSTPQPPPPTPKISGLKTVAEATTLQDLRTIAERGDGAAQFALGAHYATGNEVKQDYSEAARWFSKAAEQGHVTAQATLGAYYWAGRGVPQDLGKAYFWSILARAGGDEGSKYRAAALTSRLSHVQVLAAQQQADDWIKQHQLTSKSTPAR